MVCAIKSVNAKHGHVSHDALCLFSVWCEQKQGLPPSSVDTTVPRALRCEYVRAWWHIHRNIRTTPAVLNRMSTFALNRNGFLVHPRDSHAWRPSFTHSIRAFCRPCSRRGFFPSRCLSGVCLFLGIPWYLFALLVYLVGISRAFVVLLPFPCNWSL